MNTRTELRKSDVLLVAHNLVEDEGAVDMI